MFVNRYLRYLQATLHVWRGQSQFGIVWETLGNFLVSLAVFR